MLAASPQAQAMIPAPETPTVTIDEPVKNGSDPITGIAVYAETNDPISGASVSVSDEAGNIVCTTTTGGSGQWSCVPTSPLVGDTRIWARLTDSRGETAEDDAYVFGPDCCCEEGNPPAYIEITPSASVKADGLEYHTVTLHVRDSVSCEPRHGYNVEWVFDPHLQVKPGTSAPTITDANGEAKAQFVSTYPNVDTGWPVNVKVDGVLLSEVNLAPVYLKYKLRDVRVEIDEPANPGSNPITGTASYYDNDEPLNGADVVVRDEDGLTLCSTATGQNGRWSCTPNRDLLNDSTIYATVTDPVTGATGDDTARIYVICCCDDDVKASVYLAASPTGPVAADGVTSYTVTVNYRDSMTCNPVYSHLIEWVVDSHLQVKPGTTLQTTTDADDRATGQFVSTSPNTNTGWPVNVKVDGVLLTEGNLAPVYLKYSGVPSGVDAQGNLNNIETRSGGIWVRGWAADNDAPTATTQVLVSIGGVLGKGETHTLDAKLQRTDIPRTYPQFGEYHGFNQTLTTKMRGQQQVYVYAVNAPGTGGTPEKLIAIRSVFIGVDPHGNLNNIETRPGGIWVRGWAADEDSPHGILKVIVSIGGELGKGETHTLTAGLQRTDIPRTYPLFGEMHGFNQTLTSKLRGTQQVYVYAQNIADTGGADKLIAIRTVTIQ
jgi:hypothetical protein